MNDTENRELLIYALNKSFVQIEDTLPTLGYQKNEVYYYVSDAIARIINCYERIKIPIEDEEYKYISALRFINNCLKHNASLNFFHNELSGWATIPTRVDGKALFTSHIWNSLSYVMPDKKHKKIFYEQQKAYETYLSGKNILYTLRYYIRQINLVHMNYTGIPFSNEYIMEYTMQYDWQLVLEDKEKL